MQGVYRNAWYVIGILVPFVTLGGIASLVQDLGPPLLPAAVTWNAGFGDFALLVTVPIAFVAVMFIAPARDRNARVRAFLDSLLIAAAVLFVAWIFGLGAVFHAGNASTMNKIVRIDNPLIDLTFFVLLIFIVSGSPRGVRLSFGLLAAAMAGNLVGDTTQSYLALLNQRGHGLPTDAFSVMSFLLIILAALHARTSPAKGKMMIASPLHSMVPYTAVVGAMAAGIFTWIQGGPLDPLLTIDAVVIGFMILLRQMMELRENVALTRELQVRTEEVEANEARFRGLVQNSMDATLILDTTGVVTFAAPAVQRILGVHPDELINAKLIRLIHPDDVGRVALRVDEAAARSGAGGIMEFRIRHRDGHWVNVEAIPTNLVDVRGVNGIVLNTWDVTQRRQLEDRLRHLAFHDPLTELANRALFHDRLAHALNGRDQSRPIALLYIDLDDFKKVNDTLGHSAGDDLLRMAAERIGQCLRSGDTAARMGGDEFAVLLEDADEATASRVAQRLLRSLQRHFEVAGHDISVNASIGIVIGHPGQPADALVHRADTALYSAKSSGKGTSVVFEPAMEFLGQRKPRLIAPDQQRRS